MTEHGTGEEHDDLELEAETVTDLEPADAAADAVLGGDINQLSKATTCCGVHFPTH